MTGIFWAFFGLMPIAWLVFVIFALFRRGEVYNNVEGDVTYGDMAAMWLIDHPGWHETSEIAQIIACRRLALLGPILHVTPGLEREGSRWRVAP